MTYNQITLGFCLLQIRWQAVLQQFNLALKTGINKLKCYALECKPILLRLFYRTCTILLDSL